MQCWMKFVPVKKGRISIDTWRSSSQLLLVSEIRMRVPLKAELSRAQSASSGAPWVRKFRYLPIRPYTLWGWGKGIRCPSVGEMNMLYFLCGKSCDSFAQPVFFLGGKFQLIWGCHVTTVLRSRSQFAVHFEKTGRDYSGFISMARILAIKYCAASR